jgi:hypothetical protein
MDNTRNPTSARRSKKRASRSRVPWLLAVLLCIWTKTVVPSFLALCLRAGDEVATSLAVSTYTHIHISRFLSGVQFIVSCLGRSSYGFTVARH